MSLVWEDDTSRIKERLACVGKVKTAFFKTSIAFAFVPFEFMWSVVQWPTRGNCRKKSYKWAERKIGGLSMQSL